jgi:two-component system sensor histidine kinase RegB
MTALPEPYDYERRRLRLDTLILLRWIAIVGQTAALVFVYYFLDFEFPIGLCLVFIVASATLNFGLRFGTSGSFRLGDIEAAVLLGYDIIQLGFLLYLTGGLTNGFAMLFLAPVTISAVSLPRNMTLLLGISMMTVATFLFVEYWPLPWYENEKLVFPMLYRASILAALGLSATFIAIYAARVAEESRLLETALAATELVLAREQHLSQLDGLAAAAAHELGTPLATITLIVKELQKTGTDAAPELRDDLILLAQETARCREILGKLTSLNSADEIEDDGPGFSPTVLARLGEPYLRGRPTDRRTKKEEESGLGLGLFIAKTLIERSGAMVDMTNVSPPRTGAIVKMTWPRAAIEITGAAVSTD